MVEIARQAGHSPTMTLSTYGACVLNRAEVVALRSSRGRIAGAEVRVDGEDVSVDARVVINAAGPWVDHVRRLEDPRLGTSVRLSKGAHALVALEDEWTAALTIAQDAVRVTFAVPWYDMLLLGTTDTEHEGDPKDVHVGPTDADQILAEASVALSADVVAADRVRAMYAGLRVLPAGERESVSARRETVFSRSPGGMLNVAGGKLTTYRRIALETLARLKSELGLRRIDKRPWPLPGAIGLDSASLPVELEPDVRAHLLHLYGFERGGHEHRGAGVSVEDGEAVGLDLGAQSGGTRARNEPDPQERGVLDDQRAEHLGPALADRDPDPGRVRKRLLDDVVLRRLDPDRAGLEHPAAAEQQEEVLLLEPAVDASLRGARRLRGLGSSAPVAKDACRAGSALG